jgi:hypothetical protein
MKDPRPNAAEIAFLDLAYGRFYALFAEVMDDAFWEKDDWYRFSRVANGFAIYAELLHYPPIGWEIERLRQMRPPAEAEMASDLFRFVRNIITHFPFFDRWDDVWLTKPLINWESQGRSIDKFLRDYSGRDQVRLRIWEPTYKRITYVNVTYPDAYEGDTKIYLRDILTEREGVKLSFVLMKQIADTQVEPE